MKQSVLEYKKLLEQEGLLVEFAEPEGKEGEDRPVTLVTYFSGGADQGTLFLCKGATFKEAYLKDAVNRGAVAYVSEKKYEAGKEIPALIVNDARKAQFGGTGSDSWRFSDQCALSRHEVTPVGI